MREVIKATSNATRERAIDLQEFLIGQGVSEHDMLIEVFKKLSADDAVDILEDIAKDFDIPLEDEIQASTDIVASKTEDEWRVDYLAPENYPEVDPKRLSDMLAVNWGVSVSADDSEYFVDEYELFPDFSAIESIDLSDDDVWNQIVDDIEFAGVYTIKYKDGSIQYVAWREYPHNDEMVDVTDIVNAQSVEGSNQLFDDETLEILRNADTSDWSAMQTEYQERAIDDAGGYDKYIERERRNRSIYSSEDLSNTSTVSFDFINDGDYDGNAIIDSVMDILRSYGVNPLGGSFEEVDYSGYPEYADEIVSQCNVDFEWEDDYDADGIKNEIEMSLMPYEIIGVQFYRVGE